MESKFLDIRDILIDEEEEDYDCYEVSYADYGDNDYDDINNLSCHIDDKPKYLEKIIEYILK